MARGTRLGALFVWLASMGCGSSPSASQEGGLEETGQAAPLPVEGIVAVAPVEPLSPAPVDAVTADAGEVSFLEAPPSLPAPTCIPSPSAAPPVKAQACAVSSVWADGRRQAARYNSDGRLLELRTSDSAGALLSVETHVWRDGIELQRRVSYAGGGYDQTDWIYDQQRLVLRLDHGNRYRLTEYEYEKGLMYMSRTRDLDGVFLGRSEFSHDAQGRLTHIGSEACDLDLDRCESRSYWPNGQLRQHNWSVGYQRTFSEEYNELGWLIGSTWATGSAGGSSGTTRLYDSAGRLSRVQTQSSWEFRDAHALSVRSYTKGGWRERFAEDTTHYPSVTNPDRPVTHTYRSHTQRASFLCGSSAIALQEWDLNEDGAVDASRTYTHDNTGRLVREEYSGTPGMDDGPLRRDFSYDCY